MELDYKIPDQNKNNNEKKQKNLKSQPDPPPPGGTAHIAFAKYDYEYTGQSLTNLPEGTPLKKHVPTPAQIFTVTLTLEAYFLKQFASSLNSVTDQSIKTLPGFSILEDALRGLIQQEDLAPTMDILINGDCVWKFVRLHLMKKLFGMFGVLPRKITEILLSEFEICLVMNTGRPYKFHSDERLLIKKFNRAQMYLAVYPAKKAPIQINEITAPEGFCHYSDLRNAGYVISRNKPQDKTDSKGNPNETEAAEFSELIAKYNIRNTVKISSNRTSMKKATPEVKA